MKRSETEKGPGAATPEPHCIANQANAETAYTLTDPTGNQFESGADQLCVAPASKLGRDGLESPLCGSKAQRPLDGLRVAYRDSEGRIWRYRGKRARVLDMLATMPEGVTQWDCLPWHTRLGASIHAMREDGLIVSTELEGPYRHARYRLAMRLLPSIAQGSRLINNQNKSSGGGDGG